MWSWVMHVLLFTDATKTWPYKITIGKLSPNYDLAQWVRTSLATHFYLLLLISQHQSFDDYADLWRLQEIVWRCSERVWGIVEESSGRGAASLDLNSPGTWLPLSPGADSPFRCGLGEEWQLSVLCPTGGDLIAVGVVLSVGQPVFCWCW